MEIKHPGSAAAKKVMEAFGSVSSAEGSGTNARTTQSAADARNITNRFEVERAYGLNRSRGGGGLRGLAKAYAKRKVKGE